MKVIDRSTMQFDGDQVTFYKMDTGHEAIVRNYGPCTVTTKSGNYASQPTMMKVWAKISEFESNRVQVGA